MPNSNALAGPSWLDYRSSNRHRYLCTELFGLEWLGLSDEAWLVTMLAVAVVIAAWMASTRADIAYLLVLAWAFAGIGVRHAGNDIVATASWVATAVVLLLVLVSLFRRRRGLPATPAVT